MRRWAAIAALLTLLALIVASAAVKAQARSGRVEGRGDGRARQTGGGRRRDFDVARGAGTFDAAGDGSHGPAREGVRQAGLVALGCRCREPLTTFRKWWSDKRPFDQ